jgi:hypothetical protein
MTNNLNRSHLALCVLALLVPVGRAAASDMSFAVGTYLEVSQTSTNGNWNQAYPTYPDTTLDGGFVNQHASTQDFFCGLTTVAGDFTSGSYPTTVRLLQDSQEWRLYVDAKNWVSATARCVPFTSFVGYNSGWLQLHGDVDKGNWLWPDSCLSSWTGVSGGFDGGGESAGIWPYAANNPSPWTQVSFKVVRNAMGQAAANPNDAWGNSFYLGSDPGKRYWWGRYHWQQGWSSVRMLPVNDTFCFLAAMGGKFRGGGEAVQVIRGSDDYWYLTGHSMQVGVWAEAECLSYQSQW